MHFARSEYRKEDLNNHKKHTNLQHFKTMTDQLQQLTAALSNGELPPAYDAKAIKKHIKTFQKWQDSRVVRIYPLRALTYANTVYCVYACPVQGTEIADTTVQAIKDVVNKIDVGNIRYDSVQCHAWQYLTIEPTTGKHTAIDEEHYDAVMQVSDMFDGVVLFTDSYLGGMFGGKVDERQIDCHYAIFGLEKAPNNYEVQAISNATLGLPDTNIPVERYQDPEEEEEKKEDEESTGQTAATKQYERLTTILSIIATIGFIIYWFFFR